MAIFNALVVIFWIIFALYWLFSAIGVKKNIRNEEWRRNAGIRILLAVIVVILFQVGSSWQFSEYRFGEGVQLIGVVLCAAGVAFAIWARRCLGKNWSGTPAMKEGHELVTSGPYRFVRHPIYTGMLTAILGSALVGGVIWFAVFIIFCANFFYRVPIEERYMSQLFPNQYPEYKKRTKAVVPFVW
jgi:protein-S-isoprenylcysteine O-methyltransferase Ste14